MRELNLGAIPIGPELEAVTRLYPEPGSLEAYGTQPSSHNRLARQGQFVTKENPRSLSQQSVGLLGHSPA